MVLWGLCVVDTQVMDDILWLRDMSGTGWVSAGPVLAEVADEELEKTHKKNVSPSKERVK